MIQQNGMENGTIKSGQVHFPNFSQAYNLKKKEEKTTLYEDNCSCKHVEIKLNLLKVTLKNFSLSTKIFKDNL